MRLRLGAGGEVAIGDREMLDALSPFSRSYDSSSLRRVQT
jgi:hypothetical protein